MPGLVATMPDLEAALINSQQAADDSRVARTRGGDVRLLPLRAPFTNARPAASSSSAAA